jgi:predicted RNase H-like HicB family nuclease
MGSLHLVPRWVKIVVGIAGKKQKPRSNYAPGKIMKFRILIEQDEDGLFIAECPSLPGCVSQGESRPQALENIQDAIKGYLESLKKHGEPIPPPMEEEIIEIPL